ncbi:hypothetical protein BHE74_00042768 [Ensete ventricosum]|nr:hypothetical protein BHE74_00042768 [Ensete ventricosum]
MWHGVSCPRPMPLQPHVLRTFQSYSEGQQRGLALSLDPTPFSPEPQTLLSREGHSGFLLTWASEGPLWVTPPIFKERFVQDRHPRDGPRDKPTEPCVEDPRGSINPRRKFRPPPTLTDLRTRTKTGRADTSA